ncbi:hypothetical protein J1N35_028521 [Gossypium stocksii]|uniref:DUF4371 domain-containing protein n=1 Tax=Gossypium stocksii TaxID=47602 RepID=A0A9D3ZS23_9ROSI|nr:hypothetical protein J1N35_028521 [Gossypium stocksii]
MFLMHDSNLIHLNLIRFLDTTSLTLEKAICEVILHHCLNVDDIRDQGYDGASNMLGKWNDLQALFAKKVQFAYYVHCLSHCLQLTLGDIPKELFLFVNFFSYLIGIINLVASSSKRHDQLRDIEASHVAELIDSASLNSLMWMSDSICVVLQDIIKSDNLTQKSEVDGIYDPMTIVEFVFILHFMIEMLGIIADLYQALQYKS